MKKILLLVFIALLISCSFLMGAEEEFTTETDDNGFKIIKVDGEQIARYDPGKWSFSQTGSIDVGGKSHPTFSAKNNGKDGEGLEIGGARVSMKRFDQVYFSKVGGDTNIEIVGTGDIEVGGNRYQEMRDPNFIINQNNEVKSASFNSWEGLYGFKKGDQHLFVQARHTSSGTIKGSNVRFDFEDEEGFVDFENARVTLGNQIIDSGTKKVTASFDNKGFTRLSLNEGEFVDRLIVGNRALDYRFSAPDDFNIIYSRSGVSASEIGSTGIFVKEKPDGSVEKYLFYGEVTRSGTQQKYSGKRGSFAEEAYEKNRLAVSGNADLTKYRKVIRFENGKVKYSTRQVQSPGQYTVTSSSPQRNYDVSLSLGRKEGLIVEASKSTGGKRVAMEDLSSQEGLLSTGTGYKAVSVARDLYMLGRYIIKGE